MNEFEDGLWQRLVEEHDADDLSLTFGPQRRAPRRLLVGGGATATAAIAATAVIVFSATGGTPPAYAMTQNADGSYTFTINDLATAAPELNAKFKQLGIEETVVTASASCAASDNITDELQIYPGEKLTDTLTVEPGGKYLEPGFTGVIGAEQLSDGEVAMTMEAVPPADVPSCFPLQPFKFVNVGNGTLTQQQLPTITPSTPGG
jgi:outer membrane murein-binding lipoprotein Lpp